MFCMLKDQGHKQICKLIFMMVLLARVDGICSAERWSGKSLSSNVFFPVFYTICVCLENPISHHCAHGRKHVFVCESVHWRVRRSRHSYLYACWCLWIDRTQPNVNPEDKSNLQCAHSLSSTVLSFFPSLALSFAQTFHCLVKAAPGWWLCLVIFYLPALLSHSGHTEDS